MPKRADDRVEVYLPPRPFPSDVARPITMLDSLTNRLSGVIKTLRGQARLTEANVQDALREVRVALLEADVALPVVRDFIARVQGEGPRPGGRGQPHAGPGAGGRRARRTDGADGRRERRAQPCDGAAGDDPDGRPAGLGQDHHVRQAREAAEGAEEEGPAGVAATCTVRPPSSSSRRWRSRSASTSSPRTSTRSRKTSRAPRWTRRAGTITTC